MILRVTDPAPLQSRREEAVNSLTHGLGLLLAIAGLAVLAVSASRAGTARTIAGCVVFGAALVLLYGTSTLYHAVEQPRAKGVLRALDHSAIFILIAGTYTPVAVLALPPEAGHSLLLAAWGAALLGILQSIFWIRAPKVISALLAVAVGWTVIPYWGAVRASLSPGELALIAAGGIAYTLGAAAYALKRPNPWPGVLGYHEVFHALTIIGATLHFTAVVRLSS